MEKDQTKSSLSSKKKDILETIKFIAISIAIVIPIRMFIAQPFIVSGESMFPTFKNGQYLIIDELSYNIGEPHRGDVVVFKYPNDPKRYFIKRIIGLPNEQIIIEAGKIKIINEENPNGFVLEENYLKQDFLDTLSFKTTDKEYFVMGDNRNRSSDSRVWGSLPENLIVGKAFLRLLPIQDISYKPGNINKTN